MNDISAWLAGGGIVMLLVTYAVIELVEKIPVINPKWLPALSVVVGLLIGFLFGMTTGTPVWTDVALGGFAGANSTWLDQIVKQFMKGGNNG
ncbi:holin [Weissella paramesenteroides]|nr:holin [Weissella paramesenteroides]